jgi:hypothetical protein
MFGKYVGNHTETHVVNRIVNHVNFLYLKYILLVNITDLTKEDFIVNELIKTKKSIQRDSVKKLDDVGLRRESTELYYPLTQGFLSIEGSINYCTVT